jgi:hypothetical protein
VQRRPALAQLLALGSGPASELQLMAALEAQASQERAQASQAPLQAEKLEELSAPRPRALAGLHTVL